MFIFNIHILPVDVKQFKKYILENQLKYYFY